MATMYGMLAVLVVGCFAERTLSETNIYIDEASCGAACCGVVFQLALSCDTTVEELTRILNNNQSESMANYTVKAPRDKEFPFITYEPDADGLEVGPAAVANLQHSWMEDMAETVNIAVFRINGGASEVRLFSYTSSNNSALSDDGRNYANVHAWWRDLPVRVYQIKPLTRLVGCGLGSDISSDTTNLNPNNLNPDELRERGVASCETEQALGSESSDDAKQSEVEGNPSEVDASKTESHNQLRQSKVVEGADSASCGNACCSVGVRVGPQNANTSNPNTTAAEVVAILTAAIAGNSSFQFFSIAGQETPGFFRIEDHNTTAWVAQTQYTRPPQSRDERESLYYVTWIVNASGTNASLGEVGVRGFAVCIDGSGNTRACVYDDGFAFQLQSEVVSGLAVETPNHTSILFGCSATTAAPMSNMAEQRIYTIMDVVAVLVCVVLVLFVNAWIKAATTKAPHLTTIPTRALYLIYFGMLLSLFDTHGGFGPTTLYDRAGTIVENVPSLNNHPVMMSLAVVLCITECSWYSKNRFVQSLQRLVVGIGFVFMTVGLIYIIEYRNQQIRGGMEVSHLTSAHSWIGVIAYIFYTAHFLFGHVAAALSLSSVRFSIFYSPFKKLFSYMVYATCLLAVMTGLSQCGYHMAIASAGECLSSSFTSMSCYEREFLILILLLWGMAITCLARGQATEEAKNKDQLPPGFTDI